jgi:DNA-binding NarL/FixJ family response regulator
MSDKGSETIAEDRETRILLVEDHTAFRQTLAYLLEAEPEFAVVAQAGSVAEVREAIKEPGKVDIAVVDLGLPDGDGVDLIRELSDVNIITLVLSAIIDISRIALAVEEGAAGVLHKTASVDEIISAVRRLRLGEALLSSNEVIEMLRVATTERRKEHELELLLEKVTPRELEILQALAEGLNSKEIAQRLSITIETERTHVAHIFEKFGVNSRLHALVFAARHGLVEIR